MRKFRRRKRVLRIIAVFVTFNLMLQTIIPPTSFALTGGPSQPEMQSFEPVGTNQMVDPFTGDFVYNIPLLDVGGYPINLSYHSGITMDQEASWVGLGWNINAGAITRNMRGLPDDFDGDEIKREMNVKPNKTWGINAGAAVQLFGADVSKALNFLNANVGLNGGVFHNNYRGMGYEYKKDIGISVKATVADNVTFGDPKDHINEGFEVTSNLASFNFSEGGNTQKGLDKSTSSSMGGNIGVASIDASWGTTSSSMSSNSREGMKNVSMGVNVASFESIGISRSATRSFTPAYLPPQQYSFNNYGYTFSGTVGDEKLGLHGNIAAKGYYTEQTLREKYKSNPGYGYIYSDRGQQNSNAILDFNRETNKTFNDALPNLYPTNLTYDIYAATGQGIGGSFRAHRNDIGNVFKSKAVTQDNHVSGSAEVGLASIVHVGTDIQEMTANSVSQGWKDGGNKMSGRSALGFKGRDDVTQVSLKPKFESYYFKKIGEKAVTNSKFHDSYGGDYPVMPELIKIDSYTAEINNQYTGKHGSFSMNPTYTAERTPRKTAIQTLTAEEAERYGLDPYISYYGYSSQSGVADTLTTMARYDGTTQRSHHISEVNVYKPDGWRYVYGIPAYNITQNEMSFAASETADKDCATGLVTYSSQDASVNNENGRDNFYDKRIIPPYAHSYLLTSVISPDYEDVTQNGITHDDLGEAINFRYTKITDNYGWRTPYDHNKARFNEGLKSMDIDDKGSVVYGKKEIWYLKEVESKTHKAEFHLSEREDGLGVLSEQGEKDTETRLMKLDSIKLFSNLENGPSAPIKTVHFRYDYSLCKGIDNSVNAPDSGKLTLKEVFFTYGSSKKGSLNRYQFVYADYDHDGQPDDIYNPDYDLTDYDRWGNYKPNNGTSNCDAFTGSLSNADDPYTPQGLIPTQSNYYDIENPDRTLADAYSSSWHLTNIHLPTGGVINIDYESDDYAYVQDERSMQMFDIVGINSQADLSTSTKYLYNYPISSRDYLFFELMDTISSADADQYKYDYFNGIDTIYFKVLSKIKDNNNEFVYGFSKVDDVGFWGANPSELTHGWVKLHSVGIKDDNSGDNINPMIKAGLQLARLKLPGIVYPGSDPYGTGVSAIKGLLSLSIDAEAEKYGINQVLLLGGYCKEISLGNSFIRLNNPNYHKKGGGVRVKKIFMSDQWSELLGNTSDGATSIYGKEYSYEMDQQFSDGITRTISSGVATYEPMIGADENPLRKPVAYHENNFLIPDETRYQFEPFGESFYPAPSVGYHQITVRNLQHNNLVRTGTGWTTYEFYTAKDYPVVTSRTNQAIKDRGKTSSQKWFRTTSRQIFARSQGFVIELNDMHGKPKSKIQYAQDTSRIAGVKYHYKTQIGNEKKLSNMVPVYKSDGSIDGSGVIGKEIEMVNDFTKIDHDNTMEIMEANLDLIPIGIIVLPVIIPIPTTREDHVKFRLATTTKVVYRYGILDRVEAFDYGSTIETKNEAYDAETGDVLLTKTYNEYGDSIYNFTYPAYWAYPNMSHATINLDARLTDVAVDTGKLYFNSGNLKIDDYLTQADEIAVYNNDQWKEKLWVYNISKNGDTAYVIDQDGKRAMLDYSSVGIKVLKSGYKNLLNRDVQKLSVLNNFPASIQNNSFSNIINSSALEYYQNGFMTCPPGLSCSADSSEIVDTSEVRGPTTVDPPGVLTSPTVHVSNGETGGIGTYGNGDGDEGGDPPTFVGDVPLVSTSTGEITFDNGSAILTNVLMPSIHRTGDWITGKEFNREYYAMDYISNPRNLTFDLSPHPTMIHSGIKGRLALNDTSQFIINWNDSLTDHRRIEQDYDGYEQMRDPIPVAQILFATKLSDTTNVTTMWEPGDIAGGKATFTNGELDDTLDHYTMELQFPEEFEPVTGTTAEDYWNILDSLGPVVPLLDYNSHFDSLMVMDALVTARFYCQDEEACPAFTGTGGIDTMITLRMSTDLYEYHATSQVHNGFHLYPTFSDDPGESDPDTTIHGISFKNIDPVNPFLNGLLGHWRKYKTYEYHDDREYQTAGTAQDGVFSSYNPLWQFEEGVLKRANQGNWINTNTITKYNESGKELENRDVLGNYSAAQFGYNKTLPIMVGHNAKLREILFDGFEEYNLGVMCGEEENTNFLNYTNDSLNIPDSFSHTGNYSLLLAPGEKLVFQKLCSPVENELPEMDMTELSPYFYPFDESLCINEFLPGFFDKTSKYELSYWYREAENTSPESEPDLIVKLNGSTISTDKVDVSLPIEGWVKVTFNIKLPKLNWDKDKLYMAIHNDDDTRNIYLDDLRIQPFNATAKSFVYNVDQMNVNAILDENNFATFYEYDEEGNLVRVKKETERGIMTIQETRQHYTNSTDN